MPSCLSATFPDYFPPSHQKADVLFAPTGAVTGKVAAGAVGDFALFAAGRGACLGGEGRGCFGWLKSYTARSSCCRSFSVGSLLDDTRLLTRATVSGLYFSGDRCMSSYSAARFPPMSSWKRPVGGLLVIVAGSPQGLGGLGAYRSKNTF